MGLVALVLSGDEEAPELLRVPLQALSERDMPGRTALLASWDALGHARGATAETLACVLHVLGLTVPGDELPSRAVPHPWPTPPPARPRRTAAHPRGYRGTIYQPPKQASPEVLDLRPHLLQRRTVGALLGALRPHASDAARLLEARGATGQRLTRVLQALDSATPRADVGLAWRHGFLDTRGAALSAAFVRLGCLVGEGPEDGFRRLVVLRGQLAIDTHAPVLLAAARLLSRWGAEAGLPWLEVAARLAPEAQAELLTALLQEDARRAEAGCYDPSIEPLFADKPEWRRNYLQGLAAGLPSDYLYTGFRLLAAHGAEGLLPLPSAGGPVPEEALTALFAHLRPEDPPTFLLGSLWALCGELPRFSELLVSIPWERYPPRVAYWLMGTVSRLEDGSVSRKARLRRWASARRILPAWLRLLERTPAPYQERCVWFLRDLLALARPPWEVPDSVGATVLALAERLSQPPFSTEDRLTYPLEALVTHPAPDVQQRLLAAPDRSFLRFELGCALDGPGGLVEEGMRLLVAHEVTWVLEAFEAFPDALVRTTQLLGSLQRHDALQVLADLSRHPLAQAHPGVLPLERLAVLLREHCTAGVESPLPRKTRKAFEEGRAQTPAQLARARRIVSEQWPRVRLQLLARLVLERLRGRWDVDVDDARVRHALQMANLLQDNRRALRRLLTRYFAGERDFIPNHPVSRAWFARHPRVNRETWLTGLTLRRELPGLGEVTLSLEQDALEALRLGTHVGSCFGLNGISDYSAAAMVLDVNRRVLYARDARGQVLARQVLSISKDDTLVPFTVYPRSVAPALESLFLDYDLAFAEALGLPLSEGPDSPEVEHVLSVRFWDDGAWDLGGPETA